MKVYWIRGGEQISWGKPNIWFVLGLRGSGKSSLLEYIGSRYLEEGNIIFDLFGSRDGENLSWLRSPYAKDKAILLLKGENVDVNCSYNVMQADKLNLNDLEKYDIIISSSPLYLNIDQEFFYAARITDLLYRRINWRRLIYVIVREAANLYYSRLKISDNQTIAKSQMIHLIREARHVGLSLGLDSLRYYAIDIDIRNLADYLFLKSQGLIGLDRDLRWLYSFFNPNALQKMEPQYFILICKSGSIGVGSFPYPEWHKREGEEILRKLDIKVEYGEPEEKGEFRGKYITVSDNEHAEIIKLYIEGECSYRDIAIKLRRSLATIYSHINNHDREIRENGFCSACKRVKSQYYKTPVKTL